MMFKKRGRFTTVLDPEATLPDINQRFIDACQNGDYPTVTRILDGVPKFNIDLASNFGKSVLRLAIENEHLEVVQALLDKSDIQNLKEALLLAIYLDHTQIAEAIIRHPKYKKRKLQEMKRKLQSDLDSFWDQSRSDTDDSQFSTDITPLMLASQFNRVHIVQILYENGDRISKPHPFHCECPNCANRLEFDSLRHTQSRLNSYKALASEAYISFASEDPILTAFVLGHELKILSTKEKCFKKDYLQLAENLSNYVCKLLDYVRGEEELRKVLNKTGKESEETYSYRLKLNTIKKKNASLDQAEYEYESLDRLNLAIKYGEKLFVAHPNCQQKLDEIWYNAVRNYSNKFIKSNKVYGSLLIFFYFLFLPLSPLIVTFAPRSKYSKFANEPFVKFLGHTVMFVVFIILISISGFMHEQPRTKFSEFLLDYYFNYTTFIQTNKPNSYPFLDFYMRYDKPKRSDIVIIVFVVGYVITEIYLLSCLGLKNFLSSSKNIINSTMNLMYIFNFALNTYVSICVTMNMNKLKNALYWNDLILNSKNSTYFEDFDEAIYWLNADRFYWNIADPVAIAEGFFAFANLLSVIRIAYMLPVNEALGPLQICLGKMITDFIKFSFILIVIFLAFMVPLDNLLLYYQNRAEVEIVNHTSELKVENNFGDPWSTVMTMLMALFGIGNFDDTSFDGFDSAKITEILCFLIFNSYRFATIIFLLNMLVASMTQSYERIFEKSDTEWKFARSRLYMEYIKEGNVIPVPFNILLIPVFILQGVRAFISYLRKKPKKAQERDLPMTRKPNQGKQMNGEAKRSERRYSIVNEELTYQKIMQRILFRYLLEKERESDKMGDSDFSELKQDLQMIRFEMMNEMKQSRDDTFRLVNHLNHGVLLLGEEVFKNSKLDILNRYINFKKQDIKHQKSNDNTNRLKADGIESLGSSIETNSSSSTENCTESGVVSSSSSNSYESLNSTTTEVNLTSAASLNENKKAADAKGVAFNFDLDIIKEEDDDNDYLIVVTQNEARRLEERRNLNLLNLGS